MYASTMKLDVLSDALLSLRPEATFGPQAVLEFELAPVDEATLVDCFGGKLQQDIRAWAATKNVSITPIAKNNGAIYQPLTDPYEIRVLEIHPGTNDEPLRGTLRNCSVEFDPGYALSLTDFITPVSYTALSYAWGPPVFNAVIEIGGRYAKAITQSLETALLRLRKEDAPVFMWIDQICINQDNLKEKEQQLPLMGKIYRHAFNTIVWLGESDPGSNAVFDLLDNTNVLLQMTQGEIGPDDFERMGLPGPESKIWRDVWSLFLRSWFTRLWIIQEVRLSRELWVSCGSNVIPWTAFSGGCFFLSTCGIVEWLKRQFGNPVDPNDRSNDSWEAMWQLSLKAPLTTNNSFLEDNSSLFTLLQETRYAKCYDSRDKIYGLLGVCQNRDRAPVRISYAQDYAVGQLYRDVVAPHLQSEPHGLQLATVLTSVDHDSPDLPSWVPDWRQPRRTVSLGQSSSTQLIYNPNGKFRPAARKIDVTFNDDSPDEIRPRGIFVDTLVKTSTVFTHVDLTYTNPSTDNKSLLEFYKFASQLKDYPAPNTVFAAVLHTLVAGKDDTGILKCPASFTEIVSLLLDASTCQSPSLAGQTYSPRQRKPVGKGKLQLASLASRQAGKTFQEIRTAMRAALENRILGITEKGYLGLFPMYAKECDAVYVLDGCHVPFLMREMSEMGKLRLVGECYVYGIMDGEAVEGVESMEEISIV